VSDWLGAILDATPGMSKLQSKAWKHPLQILNLACGVIFRHNLLRRYCADKNKCMKVLDPKYVYTEAKYVTLIFHGLHIQHASKYVLCNLVYRKACVTSVSISNTL